MSSVIHCPSCGCTMAEKTRCHSCRQPPTGSGSLPEHLFGPPNTGRKPEQQAARSR